MNSDINNYIHLSLNNHGNRWKSKLTLSKDDTNDLNLPITFVQTYDFGTDIEKKPNNLLCLHKIVSSLRKNVYDVCLEIAKKKKKLSISMIKQAVVNLRRQISSFFIYKEIERDGKPVEVRDREREREKREAAKLC